MRWMFSLTMDCDAACISELRMNRDTFRILCDMVKDVGGLKPSKNASIEEVVAMFIYTLAHHKKSRTISLLFSQSRETVSRRFHQVLYAIMRLHDILLKKSEPITQDCQDERWKCFQGCLGALDGTLIKVTPPSEEKSRYRTRKGCISTNVLGVCCPNMEFIYVLPGWEGSAHDGRVLRNAISRPHGLRVPRGYYYLVDSGYCNVNGFLTPYRGQRYDLKEFDGHQPETAEEYFNTKHSKARNVIERCFGLLKGRWKILPSPSFFAIQTQDDVEHKINCEKQWFDEWCLNHKNAVGLLNFRFPYLRKLDMVWGRDRATGVHVEDFVEASANVNCPKNMTVCSSSDSEDEPVIVSDAQ
ncbi:hypothetical protein ZIOFF_035541 [Zingiber officinale]|uniref:Transposase n=1 Tax=Zingiber officinale TaxID=94328 RepID=A0A8J5L757_ZINOF|nr:hypothetical protein ZIOFF_035541 [Zingiber officinale]